MTAKSSANGRKTAVITGGAGGLGTALSKQLQAQGWRVVLVDRDTRDLTQTDQQIPLTCDLTDPGALEDTCAKIRAEHTTIDLVIYNAGLTSVGPIDDLTEEAHRHLFEVNYFAATTMAQAFQAALRESGGTHLVITSVAGFAPLHHRAAYAASKHALTGFFGSLRAEEAPYGVHVAIAAPSFVATNPNAEADPMGLMPPGAAKDALDAMTAEQAARIILRGALAGRNFIPVGRVARLAAALMRISPRIYQWLMSRSIRGES